MDAMLSPLGQVIFMDPQQWQRVKAIFNQVADLPATERAAELDRLCQGDPPLRLAVEGILEHDQAHTMALQNPTGISGDPLEPLRVIGPYTILSTLGQGGMGMVYEAERSDGVFHQRVAIKLVKMEWADEELIRRFRHERQILAQLQHPHICRLLDGGMTPSGSPFLVMELIRGTSITRYCQNAQLSVAQRIELFLQVCQAIEYAHTHLIIHRDLKPANILVDEQGQVKLLDFGIAKLLDPSLPEFADMTTLETRTGASMMTPQYASPEQYQGNPVSTATDIYGLGLILYEVLTGRLPFDFKDKTLVEIDRMIVHEIPTKPSTLMKNLSSSGALGRQRVPWPTYLQGLSGDLDSIVLMALRKEPARRYASVSALADDLRHYLAGRPVSAHPESRSYRFKKWVLRNRLASASLLLFLFLLAGIISGSLRFAFHTRAQNQVIALERDRAREVADFLVALFQQSDPLVQTDSNPRIQDLLDRAYEEIRIGFSADSQIKGNLQLTLARALMEFNQTAKADILLDEFAALGLTNLPSDYFLLRGQIALQACAFAECQRMLDQARISAQKAFDVEAQVKTLATQAELYREMSQFPQAVAALDAALALKGYKSYDYWRIRLLVARGSVRRDALELEQGLEDLAQAEQFVLATYGPDSPAFAQLQLARAAAYTQAAQYEKGLELNQAALPVIERILGKNHPSYADALHDVGAALSGLGRLDEALEPLQQALALRTAPDGTRHAQAVAHLSEIGLVYSRKQDFASAIASYGQAVDLARVSFPPGKLDRIVAQVNLGSALDQAGQPEQGLPHLQEAFALTKDNPSTLFYRGVAALLLGRTLQTLGRHAEALPVLEESLVLVSRYPDQMQIPKGIVNIRLAKAARALNMTDRACQEWRSGYEDLLKAVGEEHPWTRLCLTEMQACNP